jgi:hypothetical protein
LFLAIVFVVSAWQYITRSKLVFKVFFILSWNLLTLATIILFIASFYYGAVGTVFGKNPAFFEVLLREEGLKAIMNETSANITNSCLNGIKNARYDLLNNQDYFNTFDSFYNTSVSLNELDNQLSSDLKSQVLSNYALLYTKMRSNIALAPNIDANSPLNVITSLDKYTDASVSDSNVAECLDSLQDTWVTDKDACPSEYKYVESTSSDQATGDKTCLNLLQWNSTNLSTRYTENFACQSLNVEEVEAYLNSLTKYTNDSNGTLASLSADIEL